MWLGYIFQVDILSVVINRRMEKIGLYCLLVKISFLLNEFQYLYSPSNIHLDISPSGSNTNNNGREQQQKQNVHSAVSAHTYIVQDVPKK